MAPKRILAKLPSWLSPLQVAIIEAGYKHLGAYATWWAIEDGKTAAVEATCVKALTELDQALASQDRRCRWATGDFGRYSGCSEGSGGSSLSTRTFTIRDGVARAS